jgi:hypothetical protein
VKGDVLLVRDKRKIESKKKIEKKVREKQEEKKRRVEREIKLLCYWPGLFD